jgi:hypothetical protein
MNGICTLANDQVYNQLVALLNSIETVVGSTIPVCVYPYDDRTDRIAAEIARRPNVQLYDDCDSIQHWDQFVRKVWDAHPTARQRWGKPDPNVYYRVGTHRRFCAFDGPFDRFLYMDADTLLMSSPEVVFQQLEQSDWVVYDFQFKDPAHVYDLASPRLNQLFSSDRLQSEIFCSGFYATQRHLFTAEQQEWLLSELRSGDAEALYPMAPDQTLLNYMVMKSGIALSNLARELPPEQRTGCCITSDKFTERDRILYDQGNRLTYLHYIGLTSSLINRVCSGENIEFPYRDLFLHYRYLYEPEQRPVFSQKPRAYNAPPSLQKRLFRKLGLARK